MKSIPKYHLKKGDKILIYHHTHARYVIIGYMTSLTHYAETYITMPNDDTYHDMNMNTNGAKETDIFQLTDDEFLQFLMLTI